MASTTKKTSKASVYFWWEFKIHHKTKRVFSATRCTFSMLRLLDQKYISTSLRSFISSLEHCTPSNAIYACPLLPPLPCIAIFTLQAASFTQRRPRLMSENVAEMVEDHLSLLIFWSAIMAGLADGMWPWSGQSLLPSILYGGSTYSIGV